MRLQQRQAGEVARHLDALADRVEPIGHEPGGGRVAVDGHRWPVLRSVGERLAIARGAHVEAVDRRDRLVCGRLIGKDGQALIRCIALQHIGCRTTGLGEADDILRTAPLVSTIAVGVGHDHQVGVVDTVGGAEAGCVEHRFVAVQQARCRCIDDPIAATRQHDQSRRGAHHRDGIVHLHQLDRRERLADPRIGQCRLVDRRQSGHVRCGGAERRGLRQAGGPSREQGTGQLWSRGTEALERHVIADPDRVGAEEPGNRCDRGRIQRVGLGAIVECVQQVHSGWRSQWQEVAGDQWLGGQAR